MNTSQIEAQFLSLFERVRINPPRDPIAAERGRRQFLKRVEALRPSRAFIILPRWSARRPAWAIASVLLASALLLSGIGVARAASGALPNQALYSVKTALEDLQIALSADDATEAYLLLQFSQRRIDEITELIRQRQFEQIAIPTGHYQNELSQLSAIIAGLMETDEPRAEQLSALFTEKLIEYERTLSLLLQTLTPVESRDVEMALRFSAETLASSAISDGGQITEIEPNHGAQGQTLTLEINGEGTRFSSSSAVNFGPGVTINRIDVENDTRLVVNITIAENAPLGTQEVSITTGSLTIGGKSFEIDASTELDLSADEELVDPDLENGVQEDEGEGEQVEDEQEEDGEGDEEMDNELEGDDGGVTDDELDDGDDNGEETSGDEESDEADEEE
jgi:hypothetical protein